MGKKKEEQWNSLIGNRGERVKISRDQHALQHWEALAIIRVVTQPPKRCNRSIVSNSQVGSSWGNLSNEVIFRLIEWNMFDYLRH